MLKTLFALALLIAGLPLLVIGCLRQAPPPVTSFMLQSEIRPVDYQWVPADQIADVARKAVVASEDQKFWAHAGFDFEAMEQAYRQNRKRERKRGASTISQQTAKNLFLWPGGGYLRKGIEAYLTVLIEWLWPKDRILEVYLNIAEFGTGIYGVEAAAQHHFSKPASSLTPTEAARLAAVLPSPRNWDAGQPGPYVIKRADWILRQMGYGRRPPEVPDPEPLPPAPQDMEPPAEMGGEPMPEELGPDADGFETFPDLPEPEAQGEPVTPDNGASGETGDEQPPRPRGGGRVMDDEPVGEDESVWDQSLIL